MKIMRAEYIRNKLHYFGEDYEFVLADEKYHNYAIARTHIFTICL